MDTSPDHITKLAGVIIHNSWINNHSHAYYSLFEVENCYRVVIITFLLSRSNNIFYVVIIQNLFCRTIEKSVGMN